VHLRSGRVPILAPRIRRRGGFVTSSAHGPAELVRAARAGADLVFLSPIFPTASHPKAAALGPVRWARLARAARVSVAALGGISGTSVRRLPPICYAVGGIGALS
jgi:thiamine-phosphate pyrophosphorylase